MSGQLLPVDVTSDISLALWIADRTRGELTWCRGLGWLHRAGPIWKPVDDPAFIVGRLLVTRAAELMATSPGTVNPRQLSIMESRIKAEAVTRHLKGALNDTDRFDADPYLLNCRNNVVDLRTSRPRPHEPEDRFLQMTGVPYVEDADRSRVEQLLRCFEPDVGTWLQAYLGRMLCGEQSQDDRGLLFIVDRHANNGKTTWVDALRAVFGSYAASVSPRVLIAGDGEHDTEKMDLMGLRLGVVEEQPGQYISSASLKRITGTKTIRARRMRQDTVEFDITHDLIITSNHPPRIAETDRGTWRKLWVVQPPYSFVKTPIQHHEREWDRSLRPSIRRGDEGLLAWLVEGCRIALASPDRYENPPVSVEILTDQTHGESNLVGQFLQECLPDEAEGQAIETAVYTLFSRWMERRGHPVPTMRLFLDRASDTRTLRKARVSYSRQGRFMSILGVKLCDEGGEEVPETQQVEWAKSWSQVRSGRH